MLSFLNELANEFVVCLGEAADAFARLRAYFKRKRAAALLRCHGCSHLTFETFGEAKLCTRCYVASRGGKALGEWLQ